MKKFVLLCSTAAVLVPSAALAQSTGTVTTEEITITGAKTRNVGGIQAPDTTKAKATITKELIAHQQPGNTILNVINLVPGVNFTNSDPYGSAGGNIRIRGFDGNRISLTFDGVPLNDSGNYAIFSNQQLDPELIEQVNVGLGVTDVDSPTASAAGGTVNYRTVLPTDRMGARLSGSVGDFNFFRLFGQFNTGVFTPWGTKAWIAASHAKNDKFKGPGEINKYQFNARIYQPLGSGGDFLSLAGNYNRNRNNFYRNPTLNDLRNAFGNAEIAPTTNVAATSTTPAFAAATFDNPALVGYFNDQQQDTVNDIENLRACNLTHAGPGTQNAAGTSTTGTGPNGTGPIAPAILGSTNNNPLNVQSCTNLYTLRINPSNTGNVRGQSRFTLRDGLILTVDPSYQYVLANGGGTSTLAENSLRARGRNPSGPGIDFNGDGDTADTVRFFTPNNTNTNRIGLTSSLIWDISPQHRVRVAYTYDRAHHRQTGEWGFIEGTGDSVTGLSSAQPESPFSGRNATPVLNATGFQIQQRNRTSIALLNQISGQYIGHFLADALRVEVGVRRPFFKRDLQTFCPIQTNGFAYCTDEPILPRGTPLTATSAPNGTIPIFIAPGDPIPTTGNARNYNFLFPAFKAKYKYGKLLPNVGFTYKVAGPVSIFGSFAKGFSAPRTDNLYNAPIVTVKPEQTNAFDLGARYTTGRVQAQLTGWKIDYSNRIVSSFNPDLGISIDRNVGNVKTYGFDGNISFKPIRPLTVIALASYIHTKLQDNVLLSTQPFNASTPVQTAPVGLIFCNAAPTATSGPAQVCAPTRGKMVAETPKWQYGGRLQYDMGPFSVGMQGKHVGARFATDVNDVRVKGYNIVDLDARMVLDEILHTKGTYLQLNLQNVFDKFYFGNLSTQIRASDNPNFAVGSPRTFSATLNVGL